MRHTILRRQMPLTVGTAPFLISAVSVPCSRGCRSTRRARTVAAHALRQFGNTPRPDCPHAPLIIETPGRCLRGDLLAANARRQRPLRRLVHGSESVDFKLTASALTTVLAQGNTSAGGFLMSTT